MKKLLAVGLMLLLLCGIAIAEEVASLTSVVGLDPIVYDNTSGTLICDFSIDSDTEASMSWSDSTLGYYVAGATDAVAQAYVDALSLGGWDSCSYFDGGDVLLSYGIDSARRLDSLDDYLAEVESLLGVQAAPQQAAPTVDDGQDYVLNTNSMKFHYPDCSSVGKMKAKNRQDYHGSRDDLIDQGYAPCGNCNP